MKWLYMRWWSNPSGFSPNGAIALRPDCRITVAIKVVQPDLVMATGCRVCVHSELK